MAFTSRANRFVKDKNAERFNKVGPGSYSLQTRSRSTVNPYDPSTFQSTTSRGLLHYEIDEYQHDPGQYFNEEIEAVPAPVTHSVFKSQTRRFVTNNHPKTPIPGPTDYDVPHETIEEKIRKKNLNKAIHDVIAHHPPSTKKQPLSSTNQMVSISKNPPSIPYGETAHGYETTVDGKLVPRTPPLLQPRSETISMEMETTKYGVGWSKSKTQRFSESSKNTEDQSAVQSTFQRWINHHDDTKDDMQQNTDFVYRRGIEPMTTMTKKKSLRKWRRKTKCSKPDAASQILTLSELQKLQKVYAQKVARSQALQTAAKTNKVLAERALINEKKESSVFKSKSKRFHLIKDDSTPGVGTYDIAESTKAKQQRPKLRNEVRPKSSNTARHHTYPTSQVDTVPISDGPGPGAYDIKSTFKSIDDIHAQNIQLGLPPKAPFLSTVGKFAENVTETKKITPGPGYYSGSVMTDVTAQKPRIKYYKAPFGQHGDMERNEAILVHKEAIGPGQYDIAMSSYLMAPNRLKFGATAVFKSTTNRLAEVNKDKAHFPGVGAYNISKGAQVENEETPHNIYRFETKSEKPFISSTDRFATSKYAVKTPGVGHYDIANPDRIVGAGKGKKRRKGTLKGNVESVAVPFGTTKRRFVRNAGMLASPGPNAYNVVRRDSFVTKTFNCTYG